MAECKVVVEIENLKKHFSVRGNLFRKNKHRQGEVLKAVDGISFKIKTRKSLGIAGESGCGKSTTGKMLLKLLEVTDGRYLFDGKDVTKMKSKDEIKEFRRKVQLMFQNPYEALNPRFTIYRALLEPLLIHNIGSNREKQRRIIKEILEKVNLKPAEMYMEKYPHQMSGGQLQRVVLARALIVEPIFLVADEPVSMLDVSVRAGILNLMKEVTEKMNLTTVYISHDLSLIQYMCDDTAIMYLGNIVEKGPTEDILKNPKHPYTKALIAASPSLDPRKEREEIEIKNNISDPVNLPFGCIFQDRCPNACEKCKKEIPKLKEIKKEHYVACIKIK